ncbi:MAG: hypothetical protein OQK99_02235, partial [Gammaproteobacteria bacterium]|nr:hypothetical protein [Gammaproteobacteria bacterium]
MKASWKTLLAAATLAAVFALGGCGSDGSDGAPGVAGPPGADGADGADGVDATADPITLAKAESCATCHGPVGDMHQAAYDKYLDSNLALEITGLGTAAAAAGWDLTMTFKIDVAGQPLIDTVGAKPSVDSIGFYVAQRDAGGDWINSGGGFYAALDASLAASNGDGTYTLVQNLSYDPLAFVGGAIIGKIATDQLDIADVNTAARVALYDNLAHDVFDIGNIATFVSTANVEACEKCHGAPYNKHGNIAAKVAGAPDFTQCHACHVDDTNGGHPEWQYMVDEPYDWATGEVATADYTYTRSLMNDTHMSHAMEFPYPQSMANCETCHAGKLDLITADANFTAETCKSCHPVNGTDAWPSYVDASGATVPAEEYYQSARAPAMTAIWAAGNVAFHNIDMDCQDCHDGQAGYPTFAELHSGYDARIADATGARYADDFTASIDSIAVAGNVVTVEFSVNDADIVPYIYFSLYGWDSNQFIVASHTRDANGLRYEAKPDDTNALFVFTPVGVDGLAWTVAMDMATYAAEATNDIPTLIADGVVKNAMVTIAPRYTTADGVNTGLDAVTASFDVATGAAVAEAFIADTEKCEACHDKLAVTFHGGSGRSTVQACKNCHVTTSGGSHLEMQSRSLDSYIHATHSFQVFDYDDEINSGDPVHIARAEMH